MYNNYIVDSLCSLNKNSQELILLVKFIQISRLKCSMLSHLSTEALFIEKTEW